MKRLLMVTLFLAVALVFMLPQTSDSKGGFQRDQLCKFDGTQWKCGKLKPTVSRAGLVCDWSGYRFRCYDVNNLISAPLEEDWDETVASGAGG